MDNKIKESREETLERILEETARNPYRRGQITARREAEKPVTRPVTVNPPVQTEEKPMNPEDFMTDEEKAEAARLRAAEKIRKIQQAKAAVAAVQKQNQVTAKIAEEERQAYESDESYQDGSFDENNGEYDYDEYEDEPVEEKSVKKASGIKSVAIIIVIAVFLCGIVTALFTFVFKISSVSGESMEPGLKDGDKLIVRCMGYTPQKGDVVMIDSRTAAVIDENGNVTEKEGLNALIVKRIIAMSGDTIDIDFENGVVKVNGDALSENYISEPTTRDELAFEYPLTIPEGYVFVLGDNRNISKDSRHSDIGLVSEDEIVGKAVFRFSPVAEIGGID